MSRSSLPPERRLTADELALGDVADAGDEHGAVDVVAVAGVADIAVEADAEAAAPTAMPVVVMTATDDAGLDDGQRAGGRGCGDGERGGRGSNKYKLLHDTSSVGPMRSSRGRLATGVRGIARVRFAEVGDGKSSIGSGGEGGCVICITDEIEMMEFALNRLEGWESGGRRDSAYRLREFLIQISSSGGHSCCRPGEGRDP